MTILTPDDFDNLGDSITRIKLASLAASWKAQGFLPTACDVSIRQVGPGRACVINLPPNLDPQQADKLRCHFPMMGRTLHADTGIPSMAAYVGSLKIAEYPNANQTKTVVEIAQALRVPVEQVEIPAVMAAQIIEHHHERRLIKDLEAIGIPAFQLARERASDILFAEPELGDDYTVKVKSRTFGKPDRLEWVEDLALPPNTPGNELARVEMALRDLSPTERVEYCFSLIQQDHEDCPAFLLWLTGKETPPPTYMEAFHKVLMESIAEIEANDTGDTE